MTEKELKEKWGKYWDDEDTGIEGLSPIERLELLTDESEFYGNKASRVGIPLLREVIAQFKNIKENKGEITKNKWN